MISGTVSLPAMRAIRDRVARSTKSTIIRSAQDLLGDLAEILPEVLDTINENMSHRRPLGIPKHMAVLDSTHIMAGQCTGKALLSRPWSEAIHACLSDFQSNPAG